MMGEGRTVANRLAGKDVVTAKLNQTKQITFNRILVEKVDNATWYALISIVKITK